MEIVDPMVMLNNEFPVYSRGYIIPCLNLGLSIVEELKQKNGWLNNKSARQTVGMLKKDAIEHVFDQIIKLMKPSGIQSEFVPDETERTYHLEISTENMVVTIGRARSVDGLPRQSHYRERLATQNEILLFPEIYNEYYAEHKLYGLITHNYSHNTLYEALFGIVSPIEYKWIGFINLFKEPHHAIDLTLPPKPPGNEPPTENISDDLVMTIRNNVIKDVLKND